jgi:hypothetical protein
LEENEEETEDSAKLSARRKKSHCQKNIKAKEKTRNAPAREPEEKLKVAPLVLASGQITSRSPWLAPTKVDRMCEDTTRGPEGRRSTGGREASAFPFMA